MTDNLPAVPDAAPALRDVARADTDSWIEVVGEVAKFAGYIAGTEFVPRSLRDSPAAATAAIMYGREVGLPPMTALTQTHVIEGRPSMSAEAMRALVLAAGHDIEVVLSTGAVCQMRGRRRGSERWSGVVEWTIDQARAAGLLGKKNWTSYPRQMLQARCTAELCRLLFPDVIHGFRAIEELDDSGAEETDALPAPQGRTKVQRAKKTASAAPSQPAPLEVAARPERPVGPPLPGDDGYEPAQRTEQASTPSDDATAPSQDADGGNASEDGADAAGTTPQTTDTGSIPVEPEPDGSDEPPGDGDGEVPDPGGSEDHAPPPRAPRASSRAQHRMIFGQLTGLGVADAERHLVVSRLLGSDVESFNDLTSDQAKAVIDTLGRVRSRDELGTLLAAQRDPEASA